MRRSSAESVCAPACFSCAAQESATIKRAHAIRATCLPVLIIDQLHLYADPREISGGTDLRLSGSGEIAELDVGLRHLPSVAVLAQVADQHGLVQIHLGVNEVGSQESTVEAVADALHLDCGEDKLLARDGDGAVTIMHAFVCGHARQALGNVRPALLVTLLPVLNGIEVLEALRMIADQRVIAVRAKSFLDKKRLGPAQDSRFPRTGTPSRQPQETGDQKSDASPT